MITKRNRMGDRSYTLKRVLAACALALAGALALGGCVKFDMNVSVNRDDTVSGTLVVAFDKAVLDRLGSDVDPLGGAPPQGVTSQKAYDDGTFEGVEYTFENTPLSQFNDSDPNAGDYIRIERDGQNYVLSGVFDTNYQPPGDGSPLDQAIEASMPRADMRVAVSFPGTIVSSNGEVSGNGKTVSWQLAMGERNELDAVAGPGGNPELALWVLWISLAAVVVVLALIVFQLMRVSLRR
ncbi:hypothetical protein AB0I28_35220 [Phytomonospora sp. NPDC050363]|uniref:LppM family (lipo)protein n=1 Tax=Phytomonospora sp. NPDC050363 TaxID=3155642 RepID=UPI00340DBFC3